MHDFLYRDGELWCEGVPLKKIAQEVGTPTYVYSHHTLLRHFQVFDGSFRDVPHLTCFAVKANSNLAILNLFARAGGGVDIVSGGELFRALKAGIEPEKIVYSGVGKTDAEIEYALEVGILMFNIESTQELNRINDIAGRLKKKARIAFRVNPDVDPETHPYISTGLKENKFGVEVEQSLNLYRQARDLANIEIKGISCHIGSQVTKLSPFVDALERLKLLEKRLRAEGICVNYLDLGGGLGIQYRDETPPHPNEYAQALIDAVREMEVTLIFEPGRVIVGNAGILLTRVLYTKEGPIKNFIIVDAGMNDLMRPTLYKSYHEILPVMREVRSEKTVDVVGPICESGDFLAKDRSLSVFFPGELMAVMSAGAYGFSMSSNYNSRPRAAEVLVSGDKYYIIRKRETYEDLIRGEIIPPCEKLKEVT
ncbi:MAG: diaminopimelate decarboxylase [Syntrophales bacterium]|nr:diaminopimelate decarboxylase [Syntrophales bacterium]